MENKTIEILDGEYWYGGAVHDGVRMPLGRESDYARNLDRCDTPNQYVPFLVSSKGRYLFSERGFFLEARQGALRLSRAKAPVVLGEGHETLRGAYLAACRAHFPPSGKLPPAAFFKGPQYNTWIELLYDQTQQGILQYAESILENGMPPGILMIDDGWNTYYGGWRFDPAKIPDPGKMIAKLHEMGFTVMLWTCPFVSPDSPAFRALRQRGCLVKGTDGEPAIKRWWNGASAVLDMTHPEAVRWYDAQLRGLMDDYGIDGFKFDAGDPYFYDDDDVTFAPVDPAGQCALWAAYAGRYDYNELRACFGHAGEALVQRLSDKDHAWGGNGVGSLVPNELAQGIGGYAFTCPDMIGGGEISNYLQVADRLDSELFVRYAQCAALMPMMQFSAAPWRVLGPQDFARCKAAAWLHVRFSERILSLAAHAARTGEPIVRYMEYEFPGQGFATVTDQFMLGRDVLAAPVQRRGERSRSVRLPEGRWVYLDGTVYDGGQTVAVPAGLDTLPYFIRA